MNRGDVYWVLFPEPVGHRPAVILTKQSALSFLTGITVALITRTVRQVPTRVLLDASHGMPGPCCVNLDAIQTIEKDLIGDQVTTLPDDRLQSIRNAMLFALGFAAEPLEN